MSSDEDYRWHISIIDAGCGIPKNDLPKVTEEFYMVDTSRSRKEQRTGLGLSICQKILHIHHSDLHIESVLGEGTTVSFSLEGALNE